MLIFALASKEYNSRGIELFTAHYELSELSGSGSQEWSREIHNRMPIFICEQKQTGIHHVGRALQ
jgi:hypothetical protein